MGRTVAELLATVSSRELTEWMAYYEWKAAREDEARQFQQEVAKAEAWVNRKG